MCKESHALCMSNIPTVVYMHPVKPACTTHLPIIPRNQKSESEMFTGDTSERQNVAQTDYTKNGLSVLRY